MPIPLGVELRTSEFELDILRKTSLFRDRPEGVRFKQRLDVSRQWLITTSDFRIDLLFTMSDNNARPASKKLRTSKRRMHERAILESRSWCARRSKAQQMAPKFRPLHFCAWWSQTGSNRRPPACKAGALPTELWPRPSPGLPIVACGYPPRLRPIARQRRA
jgi:hypothetical protein